MKFKSTKCAREIEMEEMLEEKRRKLMEYHLTHDDAVDILTLGFKFLEKMAELRISRDNWRNKYEELRNGETTKQKK